MWFNKIGMAKAISKVSRPPRQTPARIGLASGTVRREPVKGAPFRIVGIGASAGGFEALTTLLRGLPADTGMALVLIQRLDPGQESLLPSLLSHATSMPVH